MRFIELRCWGLKRRSDNAVVSSYGPGEARTEASAMSRSVRSAVSTICGGFSEGDMCERTAGIALTARRGARKEGPPVQSVSIHRFLVAASEHPVPLTTCKAGYELQR
jgi:hypothetical protein